MRIGYSYWGFLGDYKVEGMSDVSSPDGNATYSWAVVWELLRRGHDVYMMQRDRDAEGVLLHGIGDFASFSQGKRAGAWRRMKRTGGVELPDLDLLLLEWRFPVPGRNTPEAASSPGYQPDLARQLELLHRYRQEMDGRCKVAIWDLDHKLTREDELQWLPHAVLETSEQPVVQEFVRTRVEFPFVADDFLQLPTLPCDPAKKLAYVGSRYERDDVITEWIEPASAAYPRQVHFYGNWLKSLAEVRALWPRVEYHDRIAARDFRAAYGDAVAVPLLAKRSYLESGFMTPRVYEALVFGSLPVGLLSHRGIFRYVPPGLVARDGLDLAALVGEMSRWDVGTRHAARQELAAKLEFMDASRFADTLEAVAAGRAPRSVK